MKKEFRKALRQKQLKVLEKYENGKDIDPKKFRMFRQVHETSKKVKESQKPKEFKRMTAHIVGRLERENDRRKSVDAFGVLAYSSQLEKDEAKRRERFIKMMREVESTKQKKKDSNDLKDHLRDKIGILSNFKMTDDRAIYEVNLDDFRTKKFNQIVQNKDVIEFENFKFG